MNKLDRSQHTPLAPTPLDYVVCYNPRSGYPSAIATRMDSNTKTMDKEQRWRITFPFHRAYTFIKETRTFEQVGFEGMLQNTFDSVEEAYEFISQC